MRPCARMQSTSSASMVLTSLSPCSSEHPEPCWWLGMSGAPIRHCLPPSHAPTCSPGSSLKPAHPFMLRCTCDGQGQITVSICHSSHHHTHTHDPHTPALQRPAVPMPRFKAATTLAKAQHSTTTTTASTRMPFLQHASQSPTWLALLYSSQHAVNTADCRQSTIWSMRQCPSQLGTSAFYDGAGSGASLWLHTVNQTGRLRPTMAYGWHYIARGAM